MASKPSCVHLAYLFTEVPFLDRFRAAADAGFTAVEFSDPRRFPANELAQHAGCAGLKVVQITTSSFNSPGHKQVGLAAVPGREDDFREDCAALIPYIKALDVDWVHVMAGIVDAEAPFATCYRTYLDNVSFSIDTFAPHEVGVLIEPINNIDVPRYFMGDIALARKTLRDLRSESSAVMFDVYHVAMQGLDPIVTLLDSLSDVGHVQIADVPGRHEPLTGTLDFPRLFTALDGSGYGGWVSCEYFPTCPTLESLAWRGRLFGESAIGC
ncbi:MAG: TIM barrel protein [Rhizobiales bacterium]|nr:TIM barrel protein [Hyphomicrobiales bacterium]